MTVDERMEKNEYVKTLLYVFPHLSGLSEALLQSAENKAVLSYKKTDALAAAQGVAEEILLREAIGRVFADLEAVVVRLNAEERYLVGYKYFHRGQEGTFLTCTERSYYRKQKALLIKIGALLRARGWTQESFLREFGQSIFFMRVYRAVSEGRERELVRKRPKKTLSVGQTKSSGSSRKTV